MMNVLIHDNDAFYRDGMTEFMKALLIKSTPMTVNFLYEYTNENLDNSDVLVISLCKGEQFTCWPDLCSKKSLKIIIITNDILDDNHKKLPWCFEHTLFISRAQPLDKVSEGVSRLLRHDKCYKDYLFKSCLNCNKKSLNESQQETVSMVYAGNGINDISEKLSLNVKTVYSRRSLIKDIFNIQTDSELFYFVRAIKKRGLF